MMSPLVLLLLSSCSMDWKLSDLDGDGFTIAQGDCDDDDAAIGPGATETWYDGIDQNCDGANDYDADGDGFTLDEECDDTNPDVFPSDTPEVWYDCVDDNCDNNDGDQDGDGFVTEEYAASCADWEVINPGAQLGDCWDDPNETPEGFDAINGLPQPGAGAVYPGASDAHYDGVDAACDGDDSEYDSDGDGFDASAFPNRDGQRGDDCDDSDEAVRPDAEELCATPDVDDDCDGDSSGVDAADCVDFYADADGDGYGGPASECRCEATGAFPAEDADDCDDADGSINPGAAEVCDGDDNDCDGLVDAEDSDVTDLESLYPDADGDGYGDASASATDVCPGASGFVSDNSDCHDDDSDAYPGSHETETPLDGVDQDCDGDDFCHDLNCDGRPDLLFTSFYSGSNYIVEAQIFYNTGGSPAFSNGASEDVIAGYGVLDAAVADINEDGYLDIVLVNHQRNGQGSGYERASYVYWGNDGSGGGYGGNSGSNNRLDLEAHGPTDVLVEDIDGDGHLDVVLVGGQVDDDNQGNPRYSSYTYVYWGSTLSAEDDSDVTSFITPGAQAVASGDLDGDGNTDLVFADFTSNSSAYVTSSYIFWGGENSALYFASNNGQDETSGSDWRTAIPTYGASDVVVDDLDGDGFLDIVFANRQQAEDDFGEAAGVVDTEIFWGDGTRSGFDSATPTQLATFGARELNVTDIDGDGLLDVLVAQYDNEGGYAEESWVFFQTSARSFTGTSLFAAGARRPVVADVDGDGANDLVWPQERDGPSSPYDRIFIFEGDPSNLQSYGSRTGVGGVVDGSTGVAVHDINGDGLLDLIIAEGWNASDNEASSSTVFLGRSNGTYATADSFNLSTVNPLTAPLVVGP